MKINWNYLKGALLVGLGLFLFGFSNYKNQDAIKFLSSNIQFEQGDESFYEL